MLKHSSRRFIKVSMMVMVAIFAFASQSLIMAQSQSTEVEFVGTLTSLTANTLVVGSETFDISTAEIKSGVGIGKLLRIHASKNDAGKWIAREVEGIAPNVEATLEPGATQMQTNEMEITGLVTALNATTITVAGRTIDISQAELKNTIALSNRVKIHLNFANNQWTAREVELVAEAPAADGNVTVPANCTSSQPVGWTTYTIQAGDTLSSIANGSGSSVQELAGANCIANTRRIRVGQSIFVARQPIMVQTGRGGEDDGPNHDLSDDHGGQNGSIGEDDHRNNERLHDQQEDSHNDQSGDDDHGSSGSDDGSGHGGDNSGHD